MPVEQREIMKPGVAAPFESPMRDTTVPPISVETIASTEKSPVPTLKAVVGWVYKYKGVLISAAYISGPCFRGVSGHDFHVPQGNVRSPSESEASSTTS